jgi:hypothetical protein
MDTLAANCMPRNQKIVKLHTNIRDIPVSQENTPNCSLKIRTDVFK